MVTGQRVVPSWGSVKNTALRVGACVSQWSLRRDCASAAVVRMVRAPCAVVVHVDDKHEQVVVPLGALCDAVAGPRHAFPVGARGVVSMIANCTLRVKGAGWVVVVGLANLKWSCLPVVLQPFHDP